MFEFHKDKQRYFNQLVYTTEKYIIPFIENLIKVNRELEILEIGCGEGGNMKPFLDIGCRVTGVDISEEKIESAKGFFKGHKNLSNLTLIRENIYDIGKRENAKFDLIIMRDSLEHIHNQERFLKFVKIFLKPNGKIFLSFPPWHNPFGGHQQICENKLVSLAPFIHLLPNSLYTIFLKLFGESNAKIGTLLEIKKTQITIERFSKMVKNENYRIDKIIFYLINPIYEIKFNLKPREQFKLISKIPYLRNFITTSCFCLISSRLDEQTV